MFYEVIPKPQLEFYTLDEIAHTFSRFGVDSVQANLLFPSERGGFDESILDQLGVERFRLFNAPEDLKDPYMEYLKVDTHNQHILVCPSLGSYLDFSKHFGTTCQPPIRIRGYFEGGRAPPNTPFQDIPVEFYADSATYSRDDAHYIGFHDMQQMKEAGYKHTWTKTLA